MKTKYELAFEFSKAIDLFYINRAQEVYEEFNNTTQTYFKYEECYYGKCICSNSDKDDNSDCEMITKTINTYTKSPKKLIKQLNKFKNLKQIKLNWTLGENISEVESALEMMLEEYTNEDDYNSRNKYLEYAAYNTSYGLIEHYFKNFNNMTYEENIKNYKEIVKRYRNHKYD